MIIHPMFAADNIKIEEYSLCAYSFLNGTMMNKDMDQ
jgi:hypothetical protein